MGRVFWIPDFFKCVWRFNAVALAGLLIFVGVTAVWELFPKARSDANVANVDPSDETLVETLKIGSVTPMNGLIRHSVGREQSRLPPAKPLRSAGP